MPQARDRERHRSGREDGPTDRKKRPSGEREQDNEQRDDRNSEKSKSSRETADSNQECMEKRVEELTQQLQEERAASRREKLTVARLQREVARNKSEGPMREKLMKDLDLERTRREETEQKLRDVSADNEQCKTRLQSLQQDMQHMEEQVQGMVQLKQKMDQLKRERGHLIDAYENQMDSIRTHVSNLELENDDLVKKVNNYESLSDVHLSSAEEERDKTVLLMQRLKSLEAENSALVLENENQREQYERCLDEVANQVVQALMAQKDLREECLKLRNRVYDLEQQNKQLSVMFERRTSRFSSDSILQSAKRLRQRSFGGESKTETVSLDSSNHSLPVQPQRYSPSPHSGLPVSQHQRATSYSPSTFVSSRKSGSVPNGSAGETSPHSSLSSMASDYSAHSSNHNSRNCRSTPPPPLIYSVQRHHPMYSRSQSDPSQQARQQFKEDKIIERINQLRAQVASNSNGIGESMLVPYTSKQDMRGSNEGIYSPGSSRKSGLFESEGQNYDYHPHNRLGLKCHPPQVRVQASEGRVQSGEGRGHSSGSYNDDTLSWDNYSPCISPTGKLTGAKRSNGSVFSDDLGDDFQVVKPEDLYSPGSEGSGGAQSEKVASSSPGTEMTATSQPGNENGHVTRAVAINGEHGARLMNSHMLFPRPYSPGRGAKKKNGLPYTEVTLGQTQNGPELLWKRREDLDPSDREAGQKGTESEFYKKLHPEARQFLAQNGIDMSWEDNVLQKKEGRKEKKKQDPKLPMTNGLSELEKESVVKLQVGGATKLRLPSSEGSNNTWTKKDTQKRDADLKTACAMVENSEQSHKPQSLLHSSPAFVKNRTFDHGRGRSPYPSMLSKAEHDGTTSPSLPCKDSTVENGTGSGYRPVLVSNLVRRFQEMEKNEKKTNEGKQVSSQNSCRFGSADVEGSRSVEEGTRSPFKPRTEDNLSLKSLEDDFGSLSCEAEGASASSFARSPKHSPPVRDTPSNHNGQSEASNGMLGDCPINQSQVGMEERDGSDLMLHRNGSPLQKYLREPNWKNYAPEGFVNKAAKSSRSEFVVDGSESCQNPCVLNNENMEKHTKPEPVAFYQNRVPKPNYVNRQELYIDEDSLQCSAEGFAKTQTKTINANFSGLQGPRPFKTSHPVPKPYAGPPLQLNNLSTSNGTGATGTQDKSQYNVTESETVPKSSLVASDQVPNSSKPFLKVRNETSSPQRGSRKDQELAFIHNELCIHEGTASLNSSTSDLELRTFQERLKLDLPDITTIKTDSGSSSDSSPEDGTKPLSMGSLFAPTSDLTQSDASEDITPTNATARRVGESGFVRSNSFTVLEDDHEKERSSPELDKCAELEGEFMLEMGKEDGGKEPSSPPAREGLSKSQESLLSGESLDLSLFEKREGQADLTLSTLLIDSDDEDGPLDEEPINFVERWKQRSNNSTPVRLPDWSPSKTKEELTRKVNKPSTTLQLDLDRSSHQVLSENWLLGMPTTNPTSSQNSANSMFPNKNSSFHGNSGKLANGSPLQRRRWMDGFDEMKGQRSKGAPRSSQTWERGCTARPSERSRDMWAGFSDGEIAELEEKDGHVRYRPIFKEGEKFPGFADEEPAEMAQRKGLYDSAYGTNGTDGRESSGDGIASLIGKDEVSEPESLSAKERANLLDSLIGSDDSSTDSEDEADHHLFTKLRLARRSVKRNQVIRDSQAGYVSIVEFRARNMFARFGEPEQEAVACFDFLEELSISSVDREEKDEDTRQHTPLQSDQDNSNIPNKADSPKSSKDDHNNKISGRNHSHPEEGEVEVDEGAERPGSSPASSTECLSFSDSLYDSFSSNPSLSSSDT
ncbi:NCKAP5 [Branchiostoma lanceolatum]|uniref:NCKAP5 protein n=1 Tax=Branchiostoma lanceolatum TaxID=7740 RepID=A0A8K0EFR3_BRALA|nr:NCKAP5 [Branchiostoma lanceolatum]CAH1249249.1 NCKAP5 [Branchiostoma lanceolatum]